MKTLTQNKKSSDGFLKVNTDDRSNLFPSGYFHAAVASGFERPVGKAIYSYGNIPVFSPGYLVQTKLSVNEPGDKYEQEADAVADKIIKTNKVSSIQRKCDKCKEEDEEGQIQLKPLYEGKIQTKGQDAGTLVNPVLNDKIMGAQGSGNGMDNNTKSFMSDRFGADFSNVKIHTNDDAVAMNRELGARAFTTGNHIYFNQGEYQPGSDRGKHLLAHELTHVIQQKGGVNNGPVIQRSITLTDPGGIPPHAVGAMGPFPSKAWTLENWLDTLCPDGNWDVNSSTGVVSSANMGNFCAATPVMGAAHHTTSAHPTSCGCICALTSPGSRTIEIQIDENLTIGARSIPLIPQGEGATIHNSATDKVSAFTGRDPVSISGAGATTPHSGTGRSQVLPDPAWVIFGHEVCGHARLQTGLMDATKVGHSTTPEGNLTTVDVENSIRREHSTVANSLGIRGATFSAQNAGGIFTGHQGSVYSVSPGETLSGIAVRCGIAVASMRDHIWRSNGDQITAATQNTLAAGERLLVEGIDWHQVITGENLSSIARMWAIPLASLQRANPQVAAPAFLIRPGDRLLIPAS